MLETFLIKPFIAIILIAISSSLLGVFVLWKRLSYFGDALSHSILLGLILGVIFGQNQLIMLILFSLIFSVILGFSSRSKFFSKDAIIMIMSYSCIAMAVILNDIFLQDFQFTSYIFGDILTVGNQEIYSLAIIAIAVSIYTIYSFKRILLINISQDLARIEGVRVELWNSSFLIIMSLVIALSVQIVGIFLMTALLLLPAAIARVFSVSAKQMVILSLIISFFVSIASFKIANEYNLTISSVTVLLFTLVLICSLTSKNIFFKEPNKS